MDKSESIAVITDTNSGMNIEDADQHHVFIVPMPVMINGETYYENITIDQDHFFELLKEGADIKTSQPSPGELMNLWDQLLKDYKDIIYIPMSSSLSGSCASASALAEEYDGHVHVIDNHRISVSQRQSALEAVHMAGMNMSPSEIVKYLKDDAFNASIYIMVNSVDRLVKSGRITESGAAVASMLKIKPVLQIQGDKLDLFRINRGVKSAMRTMINTIKNEVNGRFKDQKVLLFTAYTGSIEKGTEWFEIVKKSFPEHYVQMFPLPISIASHIGEGCIGIGVLKNMFADTETEEPGLV